MCQHNTEKLLLYRLVKAQAGAATEQARCKEAGALVAERDAHQQAGPTQRNAAAAEKAAAAQEAATDKHATPPSADSYHAEADTVWHFWAAKKLHHLSMWGVFKLVVPCVTRNKFD